MRRTPNTNKLEQKQQQQQKLWNLYLNPGNLRLHFFITIGHVLTPVSILFAVSLTLPNADVDWVVVNLRHQGYFRVNYDAENWKALITQLNTDHTVLHRKQRTNPLCQSKSTGNTSQPINDRILLNLNLPPSPHSTSTPRFSIVFLCCGTILMLSSSTICSCCVRALLVLSPRVTLTLSSLSSSGHPWGQQSHHLGRRLESCQVSWYFWLSRCRPV